MWSIIFYSNGINVGIDRGVVDVAQRESQAKISSETVTSICEKRVDVTINKEMETKLQETLEKYKGDKATLRQELGELLKDEPWFKESGLGKGG